MHNYTPTVERTETAEVAEAPPEPLIVEQDVRLVCPVCHTAVSVPAALIWSGHRLFCAHCLGFEAGITLQPAEGYQS